MSEKPGEGLSKAIDRAEDLFGRTLTALSDAKEENARLRGALVKAEDILGFHEGSQIVKQLSGGRQTEPFVEINYEDVLAVLKMARAALGPKP